MRTLDELKGKAARAWKTWNDLIAPTMNTIVFVGLLIGLFGLAINYRQSTAQFEQLEIMRQQPQVSYRSTIGLSPTDSSLVLSAADTLLNDFYAQLVAREWSSASRPYFETIEAILPMTKTVRSQPIIVQVRLTNVGKATATKVRTIVKADRPISDIQVDSLEPSRIADGGIGLQRVTIEIDRLTPNDEALIKVTANSLGSSGQVDKLVIDLPSRLPTVYGRGYLMWPTSSGRQPMSVQWPDFMWLPEGEAGMLPNDHLPQVVYIPVRTTQPTIDVTTNEGTATKAN